MEYESVASYALKPYLDAEPNGEKLDYIIVDNTFKLPVFSHEVLETEFFDDDFFAHKEDVMFSSGLKISRKKEYKCRYCKQRIPVGKHRFVFMNTRNYHEECAKECGFYYFKDEFSID
jgi:hypothetical protein